MLQKNMIEKKTESVKVDMTTLELLRDLKENLNKDKILYNDVIWKMKQKIQVQIVLHLLQE